MIPNKIIQDVLAAKGKKSLKDIDKRCKDAKSSNIYVDTDVSPARYVMLMEPDRPIPSDEAACKKYGEIFEQKLCEVNPEYAVCRYDRSIGDPVVYIQQQQTHALWRDLKIHKGSSSNQVKPVRVLDVPRKKDFFFKMLEK